MSETEVAQEKEQELGTENQDSSESLSNRESELLREIMQKKERIAKAESRAVELEKKFENQRLEELEKKEEYKKLYQEAKTKLDDIMPKYENYVSFENTEIDKMLTDFPEEDREAFKGMNYQQLKVVHAKIINNNNNVPSVDSSSPATSTQGYRSLLDAARDYQKGNIDESIYNKVKNAFRQNQA
tara:strand:+ start:9393 stop:9947 length:555 start_codon:yes stop_codon:yes gene_type:complete